MKKRSEQQRRITAWHEAGHAVAALHHGIAFECVTIQPSDNTLGSVLTKNPKWFRPNLFSDDRHMLYMQRKIITLYAGLVAEEMFTGRRNHVGAGDDYLKVGVFALSVCGGDDPEARAYLFWLLTRTQRLLRSEPQCWQVEAVAFALMEKETLSFEEVQEIAADAARKCIEATEATESGP